MSFITFEKRGNELHVLIDVSTFIPNKNKRWVKFYPNDIVREVEDKGYQYTHHDPIPTICSADEDSVKRYTVVFYLKNKKEDKKITRTQDQKTEEQE